jgi:VWFA-related protein
VKHRHSSSLIFAVLLLALSAFATGQTSQSSNQQSDTVRVETQIVQLDLVVTDKQGKLVSDLRREDFEIFEDGKRQSLAFFSIGTIARPAAWLRVEPKSAGKSSEPKTPATEISAGRYIVLAVDDLHLAAGNLMQAKQSLLKFIDQQLAGQDQVALITTSGTLGLFQQFTTDRAALQRAISRLSVQERTVNRNFDIPRITPYQAELIERGDPEALNVAVNELIARLNVPRIQAIAEAQAKARSIVAENVAITTGTLGTLENVIRGLRELNGRKIVVLLSDGFLLGLGSAQGRDSDLRRITDAATRSGTVIYSLDTRGLIAAVPGGDASQPGGFIDLTGARDRIESASIEAQRDGLNALARDTGGFPVFNNNDLNLGLQKVLADNEAYYVLAYEPETVWRDGRFHKIEVKIKGRPELRVRTRKGYLAPDEKAERKAAEKAEREAAKLKSLSLEKQAKEIKEVKMAQIRNAIGSLFPLRGIPVDLTASFLNTAQSGSVAVIDARIDAKALQFDSVNDRYAAIVEVVTVIYDEKGRAVTDLIDRLDLKLRPDSLERLRKVGIGYNRVVQLKPGFYQARLAVRSEGSRQLGSASQWIEIPDLSQPRLALSSIFLSYGPQDLKETITTSQNAAQNGGTVAQTAPRPPPVPRRFKRDESLDFTIYAYHARTDSRGATDLVQQSQIYSGSKLIFASPVNKIDNPDLNRSKELRPIPYAARLSLRDFEPGTYELRLVVIDRLAKASTKQSVNFTIE